MSDEEKDLSVDAAQNSIATVGVSKDVALKADWRRVENAPCVECPHCLFTFAAEHTDGYSSSYSCPNCDDGAPCGWQPIEIAPKDGTEILLAHGNSMWIDWWTMVNELDGFWAMCDQWETPEVPSHWMPLPASPEVSAPAQEMGTQQVD